MGWGFVFGAWAIYLGFQLLDLLVAVFQPSAGLTITIEVLYLVGALAYLGLSLVSAAEILLGRGRALR